MATRKIDAYDVSKEEGQGFVDAAKKVLKEQPQTENEEKARKVVQKYFLRGMEVTSPSDRKADYKDLTGSILPPGEGKNK